MKRSLFALATLGLAIGGYAGLSPVMANADGSEEPATSITSEVTSEASSSVSSSVSEAVPEQPVGDVEAEEHWYDKAFEWVDNKVIPLVGTTTVTTVVSLLITIVIAVLKRKGDKRNEALINGQADNIKTFKEAQQSLIAGLNVLVDGLAKSNAELAKQVGTLKADYETALSDLRKQTKSLEAVKGFKSTLDQITLLNAKTLQMDKEAVKSGLAKQAKRIVDSLEGKKDG